MSSPISELRFHLTFSIFGKLCAHPRTSAPITRIITEKVNWSVLMLEAQFDDKYFLHEKI